MRRIAIARGMAVLAVPLFLSGCGAPGELVRKPAEGTVQVRATLPHGGFLDCGPEVVAAVLALNGKPADVREISEAICEKTRGGTSPLAIAGWMLKCGLRTRAAPGCPDATLRAALDAGIPAIAMVEIGPLTLHYYLIIGAPPGQVVCADYDGAVRVFEKEDFDRYWNRTHRYTLFVAPDVSGIPYSEDDYLRKLEEPPFPADFVDARTHYLIGLDYEQRKLTKLAKIEYGRAMQLDSRRVDAALALGNLHFQEGNVAEAERAFRFGSHAGGSCANNLAWLLSERLGRPAEAWEFALAAEAQSVRKSEPWLQALDTQGVVAMRLGKHAEALAAWRRGAEAIGDEERAKRAPYWAGAAKAAAAAGERAEATELLARAEKDGVDPAVAAEVREMLKRP